MLHSQGGATLALCYCLCLPPGVKSFIFGAIQRSESGCSGWQLIAVAYAIGNAPGVIETNLQVPRLSRRRAHCAAVRRP
jgi:hypothetical protein